MADEAFPLDSKKRTYTCILPSNFGHILNYSLLTAITSTILDVFYGRRSVHLGISGNPAPTLCAMLLNWKWCDVLQSLTGHTDQHTVKGNTIHYYYMLT